VAALAGLGLGDEGKGSFVDAWVYRQSESSLVVRYNGGPQAAHHVVLPDGRSHCFAQLGAGMLRDGTRTLLSPFMLVEPLALLREARQLEALGVAWPLGRTVVSRRSVVVTPFHRLLGRLRELSRGGARHGSCGLGVGQAWLDSQNPSLPSLRVEDLLDHGRLLQKLRFLQLVKVDQAEQLLDGLPSTTQRVAHTALCEELKSRELIPHLADGYGRLLASGVTIDDDTVLRAALSDGQPVILEGAQGALLDAVHGFFPFVTPSRTSFVQAVTLLDGQRPERLGIVRAYATRHGPGPLVSEEAQLTAQLVEAHNVPNPWQGPMRVGWFDAVAGRYALALVGGIDGLVVSCLDRLQGLGPLRLCREYRYLGPPVPDLHEFFVGDDDGVLRDLRLVERPSLLRQQRLTELLAHCQPLYVELPPLGEVRRSDGTLTAQAEGYLDALRDALRLSSGELRCVSLGPTAGDKLWQ
jgi:adenylosuccinate synthase